MSAVFPVLAFETQTPYGASTAASRRGTRPTQVFETLEGHGRSRQNGRSAEPKSMKPWITMPGTGRAVTRFGGPTRATKVTTTGMAMSGHLGALASEGY